MHSDYAKIISLTKEFPDNWEKKSSMFWEFNREGRNIQVLLIPFEPKEEFHALLEAFFDLEDLKSQQAALRGEK